MNRKRSFSRPYFWSPTSAEAFLICPRQWYLKKKIRLIRGDMALGKFVHRKIELFQISRAFKKRLYKSAESWAKACAGQWIHFYVPLKEGEEKRMSGQTIIWDWHDKGEPWIHAQRIRQICREHFDRLMQEPLPMVFRRFSQKGKIEYSTEWKYRFEINGRLISVGVDEVRPDMVLRDYKSGKWGYDYYQRKADFEFQPTFYTLAFCTKCSQDFQFRAQAGIDEGLVKQWAGNPHFISSHVRFDYYILEGLEEEKKQENGETIKTKKSPIISTFRKDDNYHELCQLIDMLNLMKFWMEEYNVYPVHRGTYCNRCLCREPCEKMTKGLPKGEVQLRLFSQAQEARLVIDAIDGLKHLDKPLELKFPRPKRGEK